MIKLQEQKMPRQSAKAVKPEESEKGQLSGALARGLAVLDVMVDTTQSLSLAEISKRARLDLSTTMRLLRTLEECRYVLRVDDGKRYIGSPHATMPLPLLHPLGQFSREAFQTLSELSAAVKATVVLVAFMEQERMVLDIAQVPGSLAPYYRTWLDGPLHASGSGKALLATLSAEKREALIGLGPYDAMTEFSITDSANLAEDLEKGTELGYYVARDEHIVGLTAVSATIPTWQGVNVGCFVMTGHTRDYTVSQAAAAGAKLHRAAQLFRHQVPSISALSQYLGSASSAGENEIILRSDRGVKARASR